MVNKFAFDLDGTLVDKKGKLVNGVVELFNNTIKQNMYPKFLICTGNDVGAVKETVNEINNELKTKYNQEPIKFAISACAGAVIIDEDGKQIRETSLSYDDFNNIFEKTKSIDPKAIVLFRDDKNLYYTAPKSLSKENLKILTLKIITKLKPIGDFKVVALDASKRDALLKANKIRSLEILTLSSEKNKIITGALSKEFKDLTVSPGFTIQVSDGSKLDSIREVFGDNLEEVMYMGDGYNDIIPMKSCKISFAVGKKSKVLQSATIALQEFGDVNKVLFEQVDYSEKSKQVIENAKKQEALKAEKKEMGRIKYATKKLSNKLHKNSDQGQEK